MSLTIKTISILVPTYKPDWYLKRCLESIQNQTLSKANFKVYIALNGPNKDFEDVVVNALNNCSFDYDFYHIEQSGVSNARNSLIDRSTEDYIVFLDDDDLISENYLEELLSVTDLTTMGISNIKNFETDLNSLKTNYIGKKFLTLNDNETSKFKTRKYYSSPCAKMLHREMVKNTRFNEMLARGEDALFMACISKNIKGTCKTHDSACYYVYEREGSATRQKSSIPKELKRLAYLISIYSKMMYSSDYDRIFIMTRVLATLKHLKKAIF